MRTMRALGFALATTLVVPSAALGQGATGVIQGTVRTAAIPQHELDINKSWTQNPGY